MALIQCPECGGAVSSSAGACVHCGYRFTVCPECGEILPANAQVCGRCGCPVAEQAPFGAQVGVQAAPERSSQSTDYEKIAGGVRADNSLQKKISLAEWFFILAPLIFCVIAIWKIIVWDQSDALDKLLNYKDTRELCVAMIVIAVLLYIIQAVFDHFFNEKFVVLRRAGKITQDHTDYMVYLRSFAVNADDPKTVEVYKRITRSAFWSDRPEDRNRELAGAVVSVVLFALMSIFIGVAAVRIMDAYMESQLYESDLAYNVLLWLIPVAVFWIIGEIVKAAFRKSGDQKRKQWLKEHGLPEDFE